MSFKSNEWMRFLYHYKIKFDYENIKVTRGHNKTSVLIEPRQDKLIELVIKNFMFFYIKIGI